MAPPRKHDTDTILDAARTLALRDGPRAVSVAAIARESGAPVGTLYHRFKSRDDILAAAWLRALHRFHERWLAAERHQDPVEAGVAMARSVVAFSRDHPDDARLLIELRRRDLVDAAQQDVDNLNAPVHDSIRRLALRLFHDTGDRARRPRHPRGRRHSLRRRPPPPRPVSRVARERRRPRRPRPPQA